MAENDIKKLTEQVLAFTRDRDWDQFHNPKDLAIALSIEASELLEAFLWKKPEEAIVEKIKEELADVINYTLLLADKCKLDVYEIVTEKLRVNGVKYPVDKSKGSAKKYSEL
jgi:NTP pyrophosphatase (non-canonical NTP hydrolase)